MEQLNSTFPELIVDDTQTKVQPNGELVNNEPYRIEEIDVVPSDDLDGYIDVERAEVSRAELPTLDVDSDLESLEALFDENGYHIVDVLRFAKFTRNVDLKQLVQKLSATERSINEGTDIFKFASNITSRVDLIEVTLNADPYFNASKADVIREIKESINKIKAYFAGSKELKTSIDTVNLQKGFLYEVQEKLRAIANDKSLSDDKRTRATLSLIETYKKCSASYEQANKYYLAQKAAFEANMKDFNLINVKNGILANLRDLSKTYGESLSNGNLILSQETKSSVQTMINDCFLEVQQFGKLSIDKSKQFEDLLKRYGLSSTGKNQKFTVGSYAKKEILTVNELFNELKKLNPGVQFKLSGLPGQNKKILASVPIDKLKLPEDFEYNEKNGITNKHHTPSGKYISVEVGKLAVIKEAMDLVDATLKLNEDVFWDKDEDGRVCLYTDKDPKTLKLPEGFTYDVNLGINNKKSDTEPYIAVGVKPKSKKKDSFFSKFKGSKVSSGKHKVTKIMKASIEPYAKAIIFGASIPMVVAAAVAVFGSGMLGAGVLWASLGSGAFNTAMQKIYRKFVMNNNVKIEGLNSKIFGDNAEKALWLTGVTKGFSELKQAYKDKRAAKKAERKKGYFETPRTPIPVDEQLDPSATIDDLDDSINFDDIDLDDTVGRGGR